MTTIIALILLVGERFDLKRHIFSFPQPKSVVAKVRMKVRGIPDERILIVALTQSGEGEKVNLYSKFIEPADLKGTAFLQLKNGDRVVQYVYIPAINATRRVVTKEASFGGSSITYGDLAPDVDVDWKIVDENEEESVVEAVDEDDGCYRRILFVNKNSPIIKRSECYANSGKLIKWMDVLSTRKIGGYVIPQRVKVEAVNGALTELELIQIETDVDIPMYRFNPEKLGK